MKTSEILKSISENNHNVIAIRHCCHDEKYAIGDFCRNSYVWDEVNECSSYYTEKEEFDGTCGYAVFELFDAESEGEAEEIIKKALLESSCYDGEAVLIAGNGYEYGNDESEVIIENAEVIYIF